jgi:hypothetical protein
MGVILLAAPLAAEAQPGKLWRIGVLGPYAVRDPISQLLAQVLRGVGYTEGHRS